MDAFTIPGESIPVFFLNVSVPRPCLKKLRRLLGDDRVVGWGAMVSRIKGETIIAVLDRDKGLSSVKEVVH